MKKAPNRYFAKLALVLASLCVALALGEMLARMLPIGFMESNDGRFMAHPTREYTMVPNVSTTRWDGVDWNINASGFRDYDHDIDSSGFRIVALGDSYLVGNEVGFEDTFLRKLELALGVEIVKLAVGGYGTIQERYVWEEEGRGYDPDLVLLGVYLANDLYDNAAWPHNRCVRDERLTGCGYDWSSTRVRFAFELAKYSILVRRTLATFPDLLPRVEKKNEPNRGTRAPADEEDSRMLIRYGKAIENLYRKQWFEKLQRGFTLLAENIRIVRDSAKADDADLVVIVIPHESQIYDWQWQEYVHKHNLSPEDYDPYQPIRLLTEWLEDQDIPFVNLLPPLREAAKDDPNLHPNHWHWSVHANQLVADVVGRYLEENDLLRMRK